jgi:predicted outer membrane repeat protein
MIFLPGKHNLSKKLVIEGTTNLNMVGGDNCLPSIQRPIEIVKLSLKANLTVEGASNFNMSGLVIDGHNKNIMAILTVGIADFMVSMGDHITVVRSGLLLWTQNRLYSNHEGVIILSNMTFISSTVLFDFEKTNEIALRNILFFLGSARSAVTFCSLISSVSMQNIEIVTLDSDDESAPGPALHYCSDLFNFQVKRTCDVVIYLANGFISDLNRSVSVLISNSLLSRPFGAGLCAPNPPAGEKWCWFLEIIIENSLISNHTEGGIDMETGYLKKLSLSLINTVISRFVGQNILRNNTGYRGGALYLRGSVIGLEENSSMIFEENTAKDIGGAIYIDDSTSVPCFLQLLNHRKSSRCRSSCPKNETCFGLKFIANLWRRVYFWPNTTTL